MSKASERGGNSNDDTASPPQQRRRAPQNDIPLSNILKIMRSILPANARITDEAKETVQKCVTEFIQFVTAKANEHSRSEQRKTVTADDLLWAMRSLGLDNYAETLTCFITGYRDQESGRFNGSHAPVNINNNNYAVTGFPVPEFFPDANGSSSSSSPYPYGGDYTFRNNFD